MIGSPATVALVQKTVEQFRADILDSLYNAARKETTRAIAFVKCADYARAKMAESRIEGLHKTISIVLEIPSVFVEEEETK